MKLELTMSREVIVSQDESIRLVGTSDNLERALWEVGNVF